MIWGCPLVADLRSFRSCSVWCSCGIGNQPTRTAVREFESSPNKEKRQCAKMIDRIQVGMIVQSSRKRRECRAPRRKCAGSSRSGRSNEVGSSPLRSLATFVRSLAVVAAPGAGWRNWLQLSIAPRLFQRWFWWSGQAKEWTR